MAATTRSRRFPKATRRRVPSTSTLRVTAVAGAVNLGRMRLSDFEVTAGAAAACKAVADFAVPSSVLELFEDAPLKDVFASIEANAARVRFDYYAYSFSPILLFVCVTFSFARRF